MQNGELDRPRNEFHVELVEAVVAGQVVSGHQNVVQVADSDVLDSEGQRQLGDQVEVQPPVPVPGRDDLEHSPVRHEEVVFVVLDVVACDEGERALVEHPPGESTSS